jgi:hypothetical protein
MPATVMAIKPKKEKLEIWQVTKGENKVTPSHLLEIECICNI